MGRTIVKEKEGNTNRWRSDQFAELIGFVRNQGYRLLSEQMSTNELDF